MVCQLQKVWYLLIDLHVFLVCVLVIVHIWMVLFGQLKEALFDISLGCIDGHLQDFVQLELLGRLAVEERSVGLVHQVLLQEHLLEVLAGSYHKLLLVVDVVLVAEAT